MSIKGNRISGAGKKKRAIDKNKKKRNSVLLFTGVLVLAGVLTIFTLEEGKERGAVVVVSVNGKEYYRGSLFVEKELMIGDTNTLLIKAGAADMKWADCPDNICVKQTPISKSTESIICLPNKVVVTIEAFDKAQVSSEKEWDAIVK